MLHLYIEFTLTHTKIVKKIMTKKEEFNNFIENAALKTEVVNIENMLKNHKENLKKGTIENYQLFDR
jgi:hypothetical protein